MPEANEPSLIVRAIVGFLGAVVRALFGVRTRRNWTPENDRSDDGGPLPTHP